MLLICAVAGVTLTVLVPRLRERPYFWTPWLRESHQVPVADVIRLKGVARQPVPYAKLQAFAKSRLAGVLQPDPLEGIAQRVKDVVDARAGVNVLKYGLDCENEAIARRSGLSSARTLNDTVDRIAEAVGHFQQSPVANKSFHLFWSGHGVYGAFDCQMGVITNSANRGSAQLYVTNSSIFTAIESVSNGTAQAGSEEALLVEALYWLNQVHHPTIEVVACEVGRTDGPNTVPGLSNALGATLTEAVPGSCWLLPTGKKLYWMSDSYLLTDVYDPSIAFRLYRRAGRP